MVSALDTRGRRIDVAKTIYYRRRKGTLRVLEELISDIAGWEGKATEEFRRLARAWHALDSKPARLGGHFTNTPPGGYADLRKPRGSELSSGPFDEYFHSADVRKNSGGLDGRFSIPKIAFWLYRIPALRLTSVMPMQGATPERFTFDPSGREIALFARRGREETFDWDQWRSLREWETPAPIRCRLLGDAQFQITDSVIAALVALGISNAAATDLAKLDGYFLDSEAALHNAISTLPSSPELLADPAWTGLLQQALIADCGKSALLTSFVAPASGEPKSIRVAVGGVEVNSDRMVAGSLQTPVITAPGKDLVIDAESGGMLFLNTAPAGPVTVDYYYGFPGSLGAGAYDRGDGLLAPTVPVLNGGGTIAAGAIDPGTAAIAGVTEFGDNSTWSGPLIGPVQNAMVEAANLQRPYVRLTADWTITAAAGIRATLTIDGLWIGVAGAFNLILAGDYATVTIRRSTLDPGGVDAGGNPISAVALVIAGDIEQLVIDHSITGPIHLTGTGVVDSILVQDSIVQSLNAAVAAIDLPETSANMLRTTVFGAVNFDRLYASEALIAGLATVADTQDGCFRFGAAGIGSRIPHPYESNYIDDIPHYFSSRVFGHYAYAQLSQSAPDYLLRGAENGSEIGAYSSLLNPILLDSLKAKVDEYLPFGLIPIYLFET
jgi:YD repeat-containing protein